MSAPGRSRDFAVTNKRVMMKVGVFNSRSVELLLNKIEAIAVNQSLVGRMFGYEDIEVTGSGGTEEEFANIQAPLELRLAVQSARMRRRGRLSRRRLSYRNSHCCASPGLGGYHTRQGAFFVRRLSA